MKKILVILSLVFAAQQAFAADQAVMDKYNKSCIACHSSGAAGAPITGNAEQWAPRMEKGMDVLLDAAKNGFNQTMPAKGMCFDCSDDDFKALIEYMAKGA